MMKPNIWRLDPDDAFRQWLKATYRHASGNVAQPASQWRALLRFAAARRAAVVALTTRDLREFLAALAQPGRAAARTARQRRLAELLAQAFDAVCAAGVRPDNPALPLVDEYPPIARPLPVVLPSAQRERLARALHQPARDWRAARNRAIALLVLAERRRPAEVAALTTHEVWDADGRVRAGLAVSASTRLALTRWNEYRKRERILGACAFPAGEAGDPLTANAIYRMVRRLLRRAGISPGELSRLDIRDCVERRTRASAPRTAAPKSRHAGAHVPVTLHA